MTEAMETKKEIYTYDAGFRIYAMNWSVRPDRPFRIALASFSEEADNKVRVVQLNDDKGAFESLSEVAHPYPPTNLKWIPDKLGSRPDLFATTAEYLRIWRVGEDGKTTLRSTLHNVRHSCTHAFRVSQLSMCSLGLV
jgi:WD repeat-containing protein 68